MQSKIAHAAERKAFEIALDQALKTVSGPDREKNVMLHLTGKTTRLGGHAGTKPTLDYDAEEGERGFSISTTVAPIIWDDTRVNVLDAPCYPDFVGDAHAAMSVCETALFMLTAVQLKPDVYWVGGIDWNARSFHGYTTEDGITYNAYLIIDEKVTLIDTTKATFRDELLARISSVIDPARIDVLIANHVEMDHSGNVPTIKEVAPNCEVYCSAPQGVKGLTAHYGDLGYRGVKTGDTLCIGKRTLSFVQTPMRKTGYSRLPVYHESIDRVVGIAHIKDLITPILDEDDGDAPVTKYLRAASYVPDTKDIIPLLSEMKGRHDHMGRQIGKMGKMFGSFKDEFDKASK